MTSMCFVQDSHANLFLGRVSLRGLHSIEKMDSGTGHKGLFSLKCWKFSDGSGQEWFSLKMYGTSCSMMAEILSELFESP